MKKFIPHFLYRFLVELRAAVRYHGNAVECPCCGKRFGKFKDYRYRDFAGNVHCEETGKNSICPVCFSLPRHRIVCWAFNSWFTPPRDTNILIFGAEYSIMRWLRNHHYHFTTADLFDKSADVKMDIQHIAAQDESWNYIICNHVLEHVPDWRKAMSELYRALGKGGVLELSVPTDKNRETMLEDTNACTPEQREKIFGHPEHYRVFGNEVKRLLEEAGFSVTVIDGDTLPEKFRAVTGPAWFDDNRVYFCRKE